MKTLTSNFNKAYPNFSSIPFCGSCKIEESENVGKNALQELTLTGFDGYGFPKDFVAKATSFASLAQTSSTDTVLQTSSRKNDNHCNVLLLNCDKVVLFEMNGQKYMLFCELKSKFSAEEIGHAKDQIVGSLVKVRSLFHSLQGFNLDEYKPIGLIVSFEPTDEQIRALSTKENKIFSFAITLNKNRYYPMPKDKTNKYFHPLEVGTIDIFYLPVPGRQKQYSVDIKTIIK